MKTLLSTLFALLFILAGVHAQDTVTVLKVLSPTTFRSSSGEKITLLGIGIPKTPAATTEDYIFNLQARIEGQFVVLVRDSTIQDPTDQKLRYVSMNDELINLSLIKQGMATALKSPKHQQLAEFVEAEKVAQKEKAGAYGTERVSAVQCSATTQKGTQCTRKTTNLNGKCWQHQ